MWQMVSPKVLIPGQFSGHGKHHNRIYEGKKGFPLDKLLSYHKEKSLYWVCFESCGVLIFGHSI